MPGIFIGSDVVLDTSIVEKIKNSIIRIMSWKMLRFTTVALLLLSSVCSPGRLPNFVVLLIDDLGSQDLSCYGSSFIDTPRIDQLAQEGMRWSNAYSACPVCSPTRVALLTGKSTARARFTGHITAIDRHRHPEGSRIIPPDDTMDLPLEEITLAEALKPAGYTSISLGKWHVGHEGFFPKDQGFDFNVGGNKYGAPPTHFYPYKNEEKAVPLVGGKTGEYLTDRFTDEAIDFMEDHRKVPFLLYLPHYAVHSPLEAPAELVEKYENRSPGNPKIDPVYAAMVERVDFNVGRMLAALDRLDLSDNTVVVFTSDNGAVKSTADNRPFRAGKGYLYEGGIRVPLIIRWPGHIKGGSLSHAPAISQDLYVTIMDIVGSSAKPGAPLDGRSLLPDTWGATNPEKIDLFWYYPHYAPQGNRPGAAVRSGAFKLIRFYDPSGIELYHLKDDPGEWNDLSGSRPDLVQGLQQKLDSWLMESNPILHTLNPLWNKSKYAQEEREDR